MAVNKESIIDLKMEMSFLNFLFFKLKPIWIKNATNN